MSGFPRSIDAGAEKGYGAVMENARGLLGIVDALLGYSKIERGRPVCLSSGAMFDLSWMSCGRSLAPSKTKSL